MNSPDARALTTDAARLPAGSKSQRTVLSQAVRLARDAGDFRQEYGALHGLLRAAALADDPEEFLAAFVRALTLADDHPAELPVTGPLGDLLWHYWRAISILNTSTTISYERTMTALDDMERRYRQSGEGIRGVLKLRLGIAEQYGRSSEADDLRIRISTTGPARIESCRQCAKYKEAKRLFEAEEYHQAVHAVDHAWENGAACSHQPQQIMSENLLRAVYVGHAGMAERWQHLSLARTRQVPGSIGIFANHITFLTIRWRYGEALQLLEKYAELLPLARLYPAVQVRFLISAAICLDAVALEVDPSTNVAAFELDSIRTTLSMRPETAPTAKVLGPACWNASIKLARDIDHRTGTTDAYYNYVLSQQDYALREQQDHERRRALGEAE